MQLMCSILIPSGYVRVKQLVFSILLPSGYVEAAYVLNMHYIMNTIQGIVSECRERFQTPLRCLVRVPGQLSRTSSLAAVLPQSAAHP